VRTELYRPIPEKDGPVDFEIRCDFTIRYEAAPNEAEC
jgi:hypothetical protein